MDSEIGDSVVVDAREVTESFFDAMKELARFATISAIDSCNGPSARALKVPVSKQTGLGYV